MCNILNSSCIEEQKHRMLASAWCKVLLNIPKPSAPTKSNKNKTETPMDIDMEPSAVSTTGKSKNNVKGNAKKQIAMLEKGGQCPYCPRKFDSNYDLDIHIRIHTDNLRYKCCYCPTNFSHKQSYYIHMYTHTGEFPHNCSYCPKGFLHLGLLKRHIQRHFDETIKCQICYKEFANGTELLQHKRVHKEKPDSALSSELKKQLLLPVVQPKRKRSLVESRKALLRAKSKIGQTTRNNVKIKTEPVDLMQEENVEMLPEIVSTVKAAADEASGQLMEMQLTNPRTLEQPQQLIQVKTEPKESQEELNQTNMQQSTDANQRLLEQPALVVTAAPLPEKNRENSSNHTTACATTIAKESLINWPIARNATEERCYQCAHCHCRNFKIKRRSSF
ncbi:zinc finger protein 236-like [Drosophila busckii]|uniref:zinc finger protein 236-like n=1 Tax=Drosophila busckii TaxID=30019 RepID=UPI00083EDE13|nr:zinc finger protein 236-like [Drosophila busckii]